MKYYVTADVHGFYTPLREALEGAGFFADSGPHKLIVCGDLLDRGREIEETVSFISALLKNDGVILIRGNHEDLLAEFAGNLREWMTPSVMYSHHWHNGTVASALSLAGMAMGDALVYPGECAARIRGSAFFTEIIPAMSDYFETEHYVFTHGWIPCVAPDGEDGGKGPFVYNERWRESGREEWRKARWLNGMLAASQGAVVPGKTVVCGHWHCSYGHSVLEGKGPEFGPGADYSPYYGEGIICLDACAALSGKLNCVVIED